MKSLRLILAISLLVISVSLLLWGFLPSERVTRIQRIAPTEMTLPTPQSFILSPQTGS